MGQAQPHMGSGLSSRGHRIVTKDTIDISKLPLSYRSNTLKEEHLLQVADNFARQYSHLCPDRVPLFLHPLNECQVPVRPGCGGQDRGWKAEGGGGGPKLVDQSLYLRTAETQMPVGPSRLDVNYSGEDGEGRNCGGLETPGPTKGLVGPPLSPTPDTSSVLEGQRNEMKWTET